MENFDKVVEACVGKLEGDEPYASMGWQEIVEWLNINWHYDSLRRMAMEFIGIISTFKNRN